MKKTFADDLLVLVCLLQRRSLVSRNYVARAAKYSPGKIQSIWQASDLGDC
jgi:hypothetical protein